MILVDGKIYAFPQWWGGPDSIDVYDPVNDTWETIDRPELGGDCSASTVNGLIYTFGGIGFMSDVWEYNPVSDTWLSMSPMPTGRADAPATEVNGKIYVIGGSTTSWPSHPASMVEAFTIVYGHIYALNSKVNKPYMRPSLDTIIVNTKFSNINQHNFIANAIYSSSDNSYVDSTELYDDGLHGDSLTNDGIWGGFISPISNEEFFNVGISTVDLITGEYFYTGDQTKFTTAGPVVLDSFWVQVAEDTIVGIMDMHLLNLSNSVEMPSVTARIVSLDTNVTDIPKAQLSFNNILPNQSKKTASGWMYCYIKNNPSKIKFLLEISSNNNPYWYDTLVVDLPPTNIDNTQTNIPVTFELKQNFPNPFNPSTKIKFSIPEAGITILKVYNILGKEVATLVSEEKPAGSYAVDFDAQSAVGGLPSGIYFYRIQAGSFVETKKMVLMK
jgi:hypothetical protein